MNMPPLGQTYLADLMITEGILIEIIGFIQRNVNPTLNRDSTSCLELAGF